MRTATTLLMVAVAVLVQATIVNRLPFAWGPGPDLVLAAVVAVALTTNTTVAALCGFAAGLAMDLLPPAEHALGHYALVLCVAAYLVALVRGNVGSGGEGGERVRPWTCLGVVAAASVVVGLGYVFVGLAMGDVNATLVTVVVNVLVGTLLTTLFAALVSLPILWVRSLLCEGESASFQGLTSVGRW